MRSDGSSSSSTAAKNASRSRWASIGTAWSRLRFDRDRHPAAYQVSYGVVEGHAAPGARRVVVRVDGRIARTLRLGGRDFRLELDLPAREVSVRVETVDAAGRRAGRTVRNVFGLPRAARP